MRQLLIIMMLTLFFATSAFAAGFTDNGNGTVTDTGTTLMWQQQDDGTTRTWENAITYCEGLTLGGHSDWRLPNIKELKSIADMTMTNPAINTAYFPNTVASFYWSSTTGAVNTTYAWFVHFYNGYVSNSYKSYTNFVRCVR